MGHACLSDCIWTSVVILNDSLIPNAAYYRVLKVYLFFIIFIISEHRSSHLISIFLQV